MFGVVLVAILLAAQIFQTNNLLPDQPLRVRVKLALDYLLNKD
jgi:hypothetical protein